MSRHRRTSAAVLTLALVAALGWKVAAAKSKPLDWTTINPAFKGATFVNDPETCRTCHDDVMKAYAGTAHAKALAARPPAPAGECESCHGPRSRHLENPTAELKVDSASRAQSAVCLQCHEGGARMGWKAGAHQSNDLTCASCHSVMAQKSPKGLLKSATMAETCFRCHAEVKTEGNKMSHHPVKEGRMDCASCHNTHGSTPRLLIKSTLTETCFTCHSEKRGPYLWEHAPVRETCANCHTPHGSNQRSLLTGKDSFLCLSCHSYGGHINLPRYNRVSNPYGSGCVNCHITTHGSNHPSGAKLTR